MVGRSVVLSRHPVVVSVVVGLRLLVAIEMSVEMPLADVAGGVAIFFEKFGESDFTFPKVSAVSSRDPTPDAVAVGSAAGENGRA